MLAIVGRREGKVAHALARGMARVNPIDQWILPTAVCTQGAPGFQGARQLALFPSFDATSQLHTKALLGLARVAGVERVLQISMIGADPKSPVEILRRFGLLESAVVASGVPYAIVRSAPFMQNIELFLRQFGERLCVAGPFRTARFGWIDAEEVGEIVARTLAAETFQTGVASQLCGPEQLDFDAVAAAATAMYGRHCEFIDFSQPEAGGMLEAAGVPAERARLLLEYWDYLVSGAVGVTPCQTAAELLGRPTRRLAEFRLAESPATPLLLHSLPAF